MDWSINGASIGQTYLGTADLKYWFFMNETPPSVDAMGPLPACKQAAPHWTRTTLRPVDADKVYHTSDCLFGDTGSLVPEVERAGWRGAYAKKCTVSVSYNTRYSDLFLV